MHHDLEAALFQLFIVKRKKKHHYLSKKRKPEMDFQHSLNCVLFLLIRKPRDKVKTGCSFWCDLRVSRILTGRFPLLLPGKSRNSFFRKFQTRSLVQYIRHYRIDYMIFQRFSGKNIEYLNPSKNFPSLKLN